MLGRGGYHVGVPRDLVGNLAWREGILRECAGSARSRECVLRACTEDILFYVNGFVWQFNPKRRGGGSVGPFLTWGYQEEALVGEGGLLDCYEGGRGVVIEKSREMGATWLMLIMQDWLCLFHPYGQWLNISRNADAVDCKSPDSLFWKLRFMHRYLPGWLRGPVVEERMYFEFPRTRSVITGEASTGRAGVGGRAAAIFVDEFSKIKEATEVRQRTANTADARFFVSTHEGQGTEFYKLTQTAEFRKFVWHWTDHPEKRRGMYRVVDGRVDVMDVGYEYPPGYEFRMDGHPLGGPCPGVRSVWYDRKVEEIGSPRGVAIELDIDPGGSVSQFFSPGLIRILEGEVGRDPDWVGELSYDRDSGRPEGLVRVDGGKLRIWLILTHDGRPPRGAYVCGVDVSTGGGVTNSVASVADARTGVKVAEWATPNVEPASFGVAVTALCWLFRDESDCPALMAWERCGPGDVFGKAVLDTGYTNVYCRESMMDGTYGKRANVPGWVPTNQTKLVLLDDYRCALDRRMFVNPSREALRECLPYHYTSSGFVVHPSDEKMEDPTGARVNHGDRVIADALCWKLIKYLGMFRSRVIGGRAGVVETYPVGSLGWRRLLAGVRDED